MSRSPITDEGVPASAEAAKAEFFAAGDVEFGTPSRGVVVPAEAAQGIGKTLAWLLGWEACPPVAVPRRPVPSAEQLLSAERRAGARPFLLRPLRPCAG